MTALLVKVAGLLIAEFLLWRLVIPDLINLRDNTALVGAVFCMAVAIVLAVILVRLVLAHVRRGDRLK